METETTGTAHLCFQLLRTENFKSMFFRVRVGFQGHSSTFTPALTYQMHFSTSTELVSFYNEHFIRNKCVILHTYRGCSRRSLGAKPLHDQFNKARHDQSLKHASPSVADAPGYIQLERFMNILPHSCF